MAEERCYFCLHTRRSAAEWARCAGCAIWFCPSCLDDWWASSWLGPAVAVLCPECRKTAVVWAAAS